MRGEHVSKVRWEEVAKDVSKVNSHFAGAADKVAASLGSSAKNLFLFRATYSYGQLLADRGKFLSPCAAEKTDRCDSCKELEASLNDRLIPLTLVLQNCVEVFVKRGHPNLPSPRRLLSQGEIFGVFEAVDRLDKQTIAYPWSISSGARSVVIGMPTKDSKLRNQFEKAVCQQISREEWDKLEKDNWELIKFAAQVGTLDWAACVLIFPGEWYMGSRPGFSEMDNYLRRIFSLQARPFTHEATVYDSEHANKPKLKWLPVEAVFYYETIKHLFQITRGDVPAFQPVVKTKQPAGPFSQFQELIVSNRIGRFFPVIFQPCHLTDSGMTGFYSLRRPSVLAYIPPKARSWKLFLDEIALDLKKFAAGDQYIDLGRTEFFCRSLARKGEKSSPRLRQTRDDRTAYSGESGLLKDVSEIPTKDWAPKDSKISLDVEFYHALIKLTRK